MLLLLFGDKPPVPATSHASWGCSWGYSWGDAWGKVAAPTTLDARSGYWRLEYYRLQEEWLKRRKKPVLEPEEEPRIRVRYLKDRQPETTPRLLPELPPQPKLRALVVKPSTTHAVSEELTIFDITRQQEFTTAPGYAKMILSSVQKTQLESIEDPAANDEILLLLLSA